jgi:hypothetical protein
MPARAQPSVGRTGALPEVPRERACTSDLSSQKTIVRVSELARRLGEFERLAAATQTEPPRVSRDARCSGPAGGTPVDALGGLKASVNPISRFDLGMLAAPEHARDWQAK